MEQPEPTHAEIVGTIVAAIGRAEPGDRVVYRPDHPDPLSRCVLVIPLHEMPLTHVILDAPSQASGLGHSPEPPRLHLLP